MADEYDPLEGEPSHGPGEAQGGAEDFFESLLTPTPSDALSDSLLKSVDPLQVKLHEALKDPLCILGPEFFAEAVAGLFKRRIMIDETTNRGMIVTVIDGRMAYLYRDERSRARYVFECILGLTWPCTKSFLEKRELYRRFDEGWATGELAFLSGVLLEDVESYREALTQK
jgi:hypothetical protein